MATPTLGQSGQAGRARSAPRKDSARGRLPRARGACRLREQDLLILDREQAPADQIEVLAEALRGRDLEQVYLSPAARRVLQTGPE